MAAQPKQVGLNIALSSAEDVLEASLLPLLEREKAMGRLPGGGSFLSPEQFSQRASKVVLTDRFGKLQPGTSIRGLLGGTTPEQLVKGETLLGFIQRVGGTSGAPEQITQLKSLIAGQPVLSEFFEQDGRLLSRGAAFATPEQVASDEATLRQRRSEIAAEQARRSGVPSPVDNVIDAEDFVRGTQEVTVGGVPNLPSGRPSPIFFDPTNTKALYYIPQGSNQPMKILDRDDLFRLRDFGVIEVNQPRMPLNQAQSFLSSLPSQAPTVADSATVGGGFLGEIPGAQAGGFSGLLAQTQQALQPFNQAIQDVMSKIGGFQFTNLDSYASSLESSNKINSLLDQLASTDSQIAELNNIARRVPDTTLQAIQGTEVTQGILDRQRTEELQKLSAAQAPLIELKTALQDDLTRRQALIDRRIDLKKDMDDQAFKLLGTALDMAVANRSMATEEAQALFDAASKDYGLAIDQAEQAREDAQNAEEAKSEAISDFYEAQGYVIDPETGELAPTLSRERMKEDGTAEFSSDESALQAVLNGYNLSDVSTSKGLRQRVFNRLSELAARAQREGVFGPENPQVTKAKEALRRYQSTSDQLQDIIAGALAETF